MVMELLRDWTSRAFGFRDDMPLKECKFAVIDTELTGLDHKEDSIVSIGGIRMTGSAIEIGNTFYRVVSPRTALKKESVVIHQIMPSEAADEPIIEKILSEFMAFCGDAVIVGHFISLDLKFLNKETGRLGLSSFRNPVVDTSSVYEWLKQNNGNYSRHFRDSGENKDLFTLAKKYGIRTSGGHNALADAFVTAQLFQRFLSLLPGLGVRNIKDLLRIGKP